MSLALGACGLPANTSGHADWGVRGNYALTYDDRLTLKLNIGGAVREMTATGYGGIVDFGSHEGQGFAGDSEVRLDVLRKGRRRELPARTHPRKEPVAA